MLIIMAFSAKSFFQDYFYNHYFSKYNDIDFYLTYNEYSNRRFFSIRELMKNTEIIEEFSYIAPFFETLAILESNDGQLDYVNTISASSVKDLKKIADIPEHISVIEAQEILISQTISEKYRLKRGQQINLRIGNNTIPYTIIDIIKENGLFGKQSVFVNKDYLLTYFWELWGITGINPQDNKNFNNKVYFSLRDKTQNRDLQEKILNLPAYNTMIIKDTVDLDLVTESVTKYGSIFSLLFFFIIFGVILVTQSTISVIFEERKTNIGVFKILGSDKYFSFMSVIAEMFLYLAPGAIIGTVLTKIIVDAGLNYVGSTMKFRFYPVHLLMGICFIVFLVFFIYLINYLRIRKTTLIKLSREGQSFKYVGLRYPLLIFGFCAAAYLSNKQFNFIVDYKYLGLFNIIVAFALIFSLARILILLLKTFVKHKNIHNLFTLISIDNLYRNKIIRKTVTVSLISFILVILLVGINVYINKSLAIYEDSLKIDYAITNIMNNYDDKFATMKENNNIVALDKGFLFTHTKIHELSTDIRYHMSLKPENLSDYLNIYLDENTKHILSATETPYVLLPIKYKYVNNLKINDTVTLYLNKTYNNEIFYIGGFIDEIDEVIISNFQALGKYHDLTPNVIVCKSSLTKAELISLYGGDLSYVIDFKQMLAKEIHLAKQVTGYSSFIIIIIVVCFILTIFNNSMMELTELSPLYSRLKILGAANKTLSKIIIWENIFLIFSMTIPILLFFPLVATNIKYLLLFYQTFNCIIIRKKEIIFGSIISVIIYSISYIFYLYKVNKINDTDVLKEY